MITSIYPAFERYIRTEGDSLTWGSSGGIVEANRWPARLSRRFRCPVANRGVGGYRADQILADMRKEAPYFSGVTTIWAGRNGVLTTAPEIILGQIQEMVNLCGNFPKLVFTVIPYVDGSEPEGGESRNKINALNAMLAAAPFAEWLVDLVTPLASNSLRHDGLHLNDAGHAVVDEVVGTRIVEEGWL